MKIRTVLIGLTATLSLGGVAMAAPPQKGKAPLVRPDPAPDPDAKGRVETRAHEGKGDRFSVEGKSLDGIASYELFVEDAVGSGIFVSAGAMGPSLEESDSFSLKFKGEEGGLPLGVTDVSELIGRKLKVRSGVEVVLHGLVPDFGPKNNKGGAWAKGKTALVRPLDTPPDEDAKGELEVRTKKADNRDRFVVHAKRMSAVAVTFSLFMEDALDSGVFVEVGALEADAEEPEEFKLKIDTGSGAPLPLGVFDVEDLAGYALEIRGSDAFTYLSTRVPAFESSKKPDKAKDKYSSGDAEAVIELRHHGSSADDRFELKLKGFAPGASVDVFLENPESELLELAATLVADASGDAKMKVSTKSGAPLPFGGSSVYELAGRPFELRESGTVNVLVGGNCPEF